ncbi:MAG: AAA family ATPase, partial [Actinomycetota bacterium]
LREFVGNLRAGPAALVIEGPAGIGKTNLLKAGLALTDDLTVLRCRPAEGERGMAFTGLSDLLGAVAGPHLESLPPPKRSALEGALLLNEAPASMANPRAVAMATLEVVRGLAEISPVLITVDDLQWIDASTWLVLRFVARRLENERVGILVAQRGELGEELFSETDQLAGRSARITLSGLDPDLIDALLRRRLSLRLPRPTLTRVCNMCDGNPFHALEIGRILKESGQQSVAPERLSIPGGLQELLFARVGELPVATRRLLVLAAALRRPSGPKLERAFGAGYASNLDRALRLRILEYSRDELRFAHPLLRTAVYRSVEESELRRIHARLADLVDDEQRAFHLALGTRGPSAKVAEALSEAAARARRRGAPAEAAELYEQAADFTLPSDVGRRVAGLISAGECHFLSGDTKRAKTVLEQVIDEAGDDAARALALLQLSRIEWYSDPVAAEQLLRRAAELNSPEETQSAVLLNLAWSISNQGKLRDAVAAAARAHDLALAAGDSVLAHEALAAKGGFESIAGDESARANLMRAVEFERSSPVSRWLIEDRPSHILGIVCLR